MRVACVNWKIQPQGNFDTFEAHMRTILARAKAESADLVVLPEFHSLELLNQHTEGNLPSAKEFASLYSASIEELNRRLCSEIGVSLVAGSHFTNKDNRTLNVCHFVTPLGQELFFPKVVMTQFELVDWGITAGPAQPNTIDPSIGLAICYDSEFPRGIQKIAEAGARVLCVPAYTETIYGFQRVRWSCHARAIENQIYVVHSSLVGSFGYEPLVKTYGSSAILTPSIEPFPPSAILAETVLNEEDLEVVDLDLGLIDQIRNQGDVRNWHDRNAGDWSPLS